MKRSLNWKLLAVLLGAGGLLAVGVHFLHAFQMKRNAPRLWDRVRQAEREGDLNRARDYLERYVVHQPDDTEARAKLGLMLYELAASRAERQHVAAILGDVLQRDPQRHDVRRRLAKVAIELQQVDDGLRHLQILQKEAPNDSELEELRARCHEAKSEYAQATECYEKAIAHAPNQIENYVRLAYLLRRRLAKPEGADQVMKQLITANGHSSQAYLACARYRTHFGVPGADKDVSQARELAPDDIEVLLAATDVAWKRGDTEQARQHLRQAIERHPKQARPYQALAQLEERAARLDQAVACLRQGLEALPGSAELRWELAFALIQKGALEEANHIVGDLRKARFPESRLNYLEALMLMNREHWLEASRILERLRLESAASGLYSKQIDLFLGHCYEQLGDADRQYAAYQRAIAADPSFGAARRGLAAALVALGKIDDAIEQYQKLAGPQSKIEVARLLIFRNLRLPPGQRHWQQAEQLLQDAQQVSPKELDIALLRADMLAAEDRLDEARQLLDSARIDHPKRAAVWIASAALAQRGGKKQAALAILADAEQQVDDRVAIRLAQAYWWAGRGGAEARAFLSRTAQDLRALSGKERYRLLQGLAAAYYRLGDTGEARRLWNQFASEQPDDRRVKAILFDLALQDGDDAAMTRIVEDLQRIEQDEGILWRYCKATHLIWLASRGDQAGLNEARNLLSTVSSRRSSWARVPLALAQIDELDGKLDKALNHYLRALELGERDPRFIRRAVQFLYQQRRYAEADQALRKLEEQPSGLGDLQRLAADVSLRAHDYARALSLARKAVASNSKDYRDYIWLGQILSLGDEKQGTEAESMLRRAVELASDIPDPWVALVYHLARTKQMQQAEAAIAEAQRKIAPETAALALAQCHEAIGHLARAEELYKAAQASRPEDLVVLRNVASFCLRRGQAGAAERYLRQMISHQGETPEKHWARRNLAVVLAAKPDHRQAQEALVLLAGAAASARTGGAKGEADEDERARALVLAMQRSRRERQEASRILEGLGQRQLLGPSDQFLLARLYESLGEWNKARSQLLSLLASEDSNAQYLAYYARALLRHGDVDEAQLWFRKLAEIEPDSLLSMEIRARLLKAQGKGEQALAVFKNYLDGQKADLLFVANLLEELSQVSAAEQLYRRYVAQSNKPEGLFVLIGFLGRQKRTAEALALCEQTWESCPAEAAAGVSLAILQAAKADPQQCQRLHTRLERAIHKQPTGTLLLHLASLLDLEGRHQDAVKLYRQVVERDQDNIMALNNLAWLLALSNTAPDDALRLVQRAIDIAGPMAELLDTRAIVYLKLGRNDRAIADLEDAVSEAPKPLRYLHLAQANYLASNRKAAGSALAMAKSLGLEEAQLHPLERPAYHRLLEEFLEK